ncbi:hypothetical protein [Cohnella rhizosphaerae]|uniref:Uncharacterized protein n=1 Tax=Cohnella rhizosphaerae TaxID=1457232 RepID=A0A9X4QUA3_9BACL|nr:hypothetical protein [Cohnella rhizosphaerae]MDG0811213.1 hypothetical protein [Cohnella rhizosphaerae]
MFTGYWSRVRLLRKLILIVVLFLILPVLVSGYYLFSTSLPLAQKESREMLETVAYQLNENIEYRIIGYQNILMQLSLDSGITATLTQQYRSLQEEVTGLQQINAAVNRIRSYFPMKTIQFYKSNDTLHEDGGTVLNLEKAETKSWYPPMEDNDKQFYWYFEWKTDGSEPSLHLSKWLVDYLSNEKFGLIHVEVTNRALFDQITNPLALKKGQVRRGRRPWQSARRLSGSAGRRRYRQDSVLAKGLRIESRLVYGEDRRRAEHDRLRYEPSGLEGRDDRQPGGVLEEAAVGQKKRPSSSACCSSS